MVLRPDRARDQENDDVEYWDRTLKALKTRLHDSYKSGQCSKAA
jgi:hypothetical protein